MAAPDSGLDGVNPSYWNLLLSYGGRGQNIKLLYKTTKMLGKQTGNLLIKTLPISKYNAIEC